jgi:NAD(P)-dependent dehydrogenase (short-subunit alcohol dehydrogenase family)
MTHPRLKPLAHQPVALVTGGAAGIGAAIARRFARDGFFVFVGDVDTAAADLTTRIIADGGGRTASMPMDVSRPEQVAAAFDRIKGEAGRIDVLVNNAGIAPVQNFLDITPEQWERVVGVNLTGTFLCAQAAARLMISASRGCIINLSSNNAVAAHPTLLHYAATKGAINSLTKGLAVALAPHGIRVNAIAPGSVRTPMTEPQYAPPGALDRVLARTPLGRIAEPDEIAGVAAFLASPDASYLTGTTIYADGGRLALNGVMVRA